MTFPIANHTYRDGEGMPLILLHGFPVDHRMWHLCATALMERTDADGSPAFPIWAPDMPGAGAGEPVPETEVGTIAADGAYEDAMDLLADAYVSMLHDAGYERAVWAGLSMGGYVALDIARRHPEAVAGLALLDTKGDADSPASRANRLAIADECLETQSTAPVMFFTDVNDGDSSVKRSQRYIDQFTQWIAEQSPEGIAWREKMAAGRPDLNDVLPAVQVPAAVVCGLNDPSSPPAVMEPIARAMEQSPDVAVTEIEDCGHFSAWERPEEVAGALFDLMERAR